VGALRPNGNQNGFHAVQQDIPTGKDRSMLKGQGKPCAALARYVSCRQDARFAAKSIINE